MSDVAERATVRPMSQDPPVTEALARRMGLSEQEWARLCDALGRTPSHAELGVVSVMWSEHCSYKSSRVHLKRLPTEGPRVVQGPGENAGAVDIGDGWCAVFKMESHNHPSYIEPYQGAATGVGGILRDVFTMGARPVALLDSLRFGRPGHPRTPHLLRGVVAGIAGYGNCIGVPTVGGEVQFDASYDGNCLVNVFALGVARTDALFFGRARGVGNPVIYVGARTGRDGIHGATMASAEFDERTEEKLPTVQVGDPFLEKLLLEACLEIFAQGSLEGVQDMGAAGLTSSSVEMAARAGTGIELHLDRVPRRARGMSPYELLLSESQERMLMVARAGCEEEVLAVCRKWDLDAAVIGRVTDTGRLVCLATEGFDPLEGEAPQGRPQVVVDLPIELLTERAPCYDRPQHAVELSTEPLVPPEARGDEEADIDWAEELTALLASPNVGSRAWIYRQFDHVVRDGTVLRPGVADAAVVRVFCDGEQLGRARGPGEPLQKLLAMAVDCNGRFVQLDPWHGAAMAVAEACRNVVCTGAEPLGLTDCLNFGNPERPRTMWRFARAVDGMAEACRALGVPVVGGNVSFYNETDARPILPTPTVAVVGQLRAPEDRLAMAFVAAGDRVALLGPEGAGNLGGGEWLVGKRGEVGGAPQRIDLAAEAALQRALLAMARARLLRSAHDVSDGGLAVALAESCLAGGLGARVHVPDLGGLPAACRLFAEDPSRVLLSCPPEHAERVEGLAAEHGVPLRWLGETGGASLRIEGLLEVAVDELRRAYEGALSGVGLEREVTGT